MARWIYAGRFDPCFLGISIRASASDIHSFRLYDRSRWAPADVLAELSDDAVVSDLSRKTVLDHELRHFRDSLLFPFGAAVTRTRIHASYNGFQAAVALKLLSGNANTLLIPLQQWLRMPSGERDAYLAGKTDADGNPLRVPQLPVIPADDDVTTLTAGLHSLDLENALLTVCRIALADYRMIDRLWQSPHEKGDEAVFKAIDAWEASAMICQLAVIERHVGEPLMQRFMRWIEQHGPPAYRRGLIGLTACLERLNWPRTLRNHLVLVTWAQMGAYEKETTMSSPGLRLATLASAAALGSRWPEGSAFADLVKDWDTVVEADSFGALRAANSRFDEFCRRSAHLRSLPPEMFSSLAAARKAMAEVFIADPDGYVTPSTYLADETRYPLPCVGLEYPSESLGSDWADVTPTDWSPVVDFETTLVLTGMAMLGDALFLPDEKSRQRNGRLVIANALGLQPRLLIL